ncbi:MAG: Hpt domain-containing protein [Treponema sp.]|jgi:HPt (histidine-containing phosphotransfer) domain-containing protein|nr:Hpt domain-containing protein [Treponema sp.]
MADDVMYINTEEGIKRVMDNTKLYVKLLTKFRAETSLDELVAALASGDMENAQVQAHTIKGISANLSLSELFRQVLELETQIKARSVDPGQTEKVKAVFTETLQEIDRVIAQNG